jgi:hypothetical protein
VRSAGVRRAALPRLSLSRLPGDKKRGEVGRKKYEDGAGKHAPQPVTTLNDGASVMVD